MRRGGNGNEQRTRGTVSGAAATATIAGRPCTVERKEEERREEKKGGRDMPYDAPTTRGDDGGRREGGRWGEQAKTLAFCTPPVRSIEDTSKSRDLVFDQNTRRHKRRARLRINEENVKEGAQASCGQCHCGVAWWSRPTLDVHKRNQMRQAPRNLVPRRSYLNYRRSQWPLCNLRRARAKCRRAMTAVCNACRSGSQLRSFALSSSGDHTFFILSDVT